MLQDIFHKATGSPYSYLDIGCTGSVWGGTGWYLVVLGQYNLVLFGFKWNWVSTRLVCLHILKKVEIWSDVTIPGQRQTKNEKGKIELLSQWTMDG